MPVLNESWSAIDAEGFVHVDMELDQELDGDLFFNSGKPLRRNSSLRGEDCLKVNNKSCKQVSTLKIDQTKTFLSMVRSKMATPPATNGEDAVASSPTNSEQDSLCHVRRADLYPKHGLKADDPALPIPFTPICGEAIHYLSQTQDGVLSLSNYRIFHRSLQGATTNIPLMLIDTVDVRDLFYLHIMCKEGRSLRCIFTTGEQCLEWHRRITIAINPPNDLEKFFAFSYRAWAVEPGGEEVLKRLAAPPVDADLDFNKEVARLQFDQGTWRVSTANLDFKLCPSYPPLLLVPANVSDEALETVAKFRSSRRIPAVVWRHRGNGAIIARCSQPEVGWLGWRSNEDEQLLAAIANACQDPSSTSNSSRKLLIIDARSYASAVTNRARGGGCECPQYYPCAEIQFMCLPNIHGVRKSFQALRALAAEPPDHANWHSVLEKSLWLQAVGGLLKAATLVARAVHIGGRPTLVHCSDGWDRTPQIVSTAQLLLDPYYRTCEGFRILIEREWLDFGHKFADRCGHAVGSEDFNERCPVFLQWLDCVHQILVQYPCSFEFSQTYLIKLTQHTYSCLFGTFLCNNRRERSQQKVEDKTFSVWNFLKGPAYQNHLYEPNREVLYPAHSARALVVWSALYLGVSPDTPVPTQPPASPPPPAHSTPFHSQTSNGLVTKTRSYGDLTTLPDHGSTPQRRSSDPNIALNSIKRNASSSSLKTNSCKSINNNNNNNNNCEQLVGSDYSSDQCDSESILRDELKYLNINKSCNDSSNSTKISNGVHETTNSDSLINTTVPKQIVNGYSKVNGNIVPTYNYNSSADADTKIIDSNSNTECSNDENNYDNSKSNSLSENGNTQIMNMSIIDPAYPNDSFIDNSEFIEQVIEDSSNQEIEDESKESPKGNIVLFKSDVISGISPTEDQSIFLDGILSESILSGESSAESRTRHDSSTWRSISEFTDSSGGGDQNDNTPIENIVKGSSLRRQRLDSVQNGGLNDTAADLLKSEIDKLIPSESIENHPIDCSILIAPSGNKQKSVNPIPSSYVCSETSDLTLCPNSPFKIFPRNQQTGAPSGSTNKYSSHNACSSDNGPHASDSRSEPCCLNSVHNHDCLGCTANHLHCLLHCLTHCNHRRQAGTSNGFSSGTALDPVDGLVCPQSPIQQRLHQIIQDYKMVEEGLRKELQAARQELQQRACRVRATPDHSDCYPCSDSSSGTGEGSISGRSSGNDVGSVSCNSRSGSAQGKGSGVLWVPDHAVTHCYRCDKHFWLGKRKHHCRSCGRIFCAECSENTTPVPSEQLYNPVRVCTECYSTIKSTFTHDERLTINESANTIQMGSKTKQVPVLSSSHSNTTEVRHLSDYCKQVSSDQNISSSPVTAASN